jgi:hypothetical protein
MKQVFGWIGGLCSGLLVTTLVTNLANAEIAANADLAPIEIKWLNAAESVLDFARDQGLPIDVVVRPKRVGNDIPVSLGVKDGRCKLVLSLREHPEAEATLAGVPASRHGVLIKAMVVHEVAHCWRFAQGQWLKLPAGFTDLDDPQDDAALAQKKSQMRATRREEGFADLVALAFVKQEHAADYAFVHGWLKGVRNDQPLEGSFHDTRAWLKLAQTPSVFPAAGTVFLQVHAVWTKGLTE